MLAVYEIASQAIDHARQGLGPALIEAKTMRMKGHAEHDDAWYVPRSELEKWKAIDPIDRFEKYLFESGFMSTEERDSILGRVDAEIDRGEEFALKAARSLKPDTLWVVFTRRLLRIDDR